MSERDTLGPPPVEPLSDVSWARVERGLWSRMDSAASNMSLRRDARPSHGWIWLAAPAIAAAAVVAVVVAARTTPSVTVTDLEPSRVVSGTAPSAISFGDVHIALDAETAIVTSREVATATTLLERGAAWFTVAPRGDRAAFVVRAGDTVVRVVGTRFRVARSDERVAVEVDHGLVEVQFRGTSARVGARQQWSSEKPGVVEPIVTAVRTADKTASAPVVKDPSPDEATSTRLPTASSADKATSVSQSPGRASTAPRAVAPVQSSRAKFDALTALETKDPDAALAGYLELSRGSNRWAEVALYAAGRLAVDRRDPRAGTLLTIYLRRFPAGANVADARNLLASLKGYTE